MQTKTDETWKLSLGANYVAGQGTSFRIWAPHHLALFVEIEGKGRYPLARDTGGYFSLMLGDVTPGDRYMYVLENGLKRPDPISRFLPTGLHGSTEVIDANAFVWSDQTWQNIPLREAIFYELHVGTFTKEGSFEGVIEKIEYLKKLGINFIELMPIAAFPGRWNWGYDGASLFAPDRSYGGPDKFKALVDACHKAGIAVCLDVVYNHLSPEDNFLCEFGPYLSETYHTPWGKALNYDGADSDHVRDFVISNALYWIHEYHIDALRLDAIHGIYDFSASPMLPGLIEATKERAYIIAESDRNDARPLRTAEQGGWELSAHWNDDFHHSAHVAFTNERAAFLQDFHGLPDLAKALSQGFVYDGKYSSFRRRRHGNASADIPLEKFFVFLQNHDQVGNRPLGERLTEILDRRGLRIAAALTLLTPSIPLLFMGEEYGEKRSFEYFVDYENEVLMRTVYEGRKREFHRDDMPFPGQETFLRSRLSWSLEAADCQELFAYYQKLIALRKAYLPLPGLIGKDFSVYQEDDWIAWEYPTETREWLGVLCQLGEKPKPPFQHAHQQLLATDGVLVHCQRQNSGFGTAQP